MRQAVAIKPVRHEKTISKMRDGFDTGNLISAREIVAHPGEYGGMDSGLSQWARATIERLEPKAGGITKAA